MSTHDIGELALHILIALGSGPGHGYAIGKELEQRSNGRLNPTTGALYQALKRLNAEGLIRSADAPADETDARRKYFELTAAGRKAVAREARRLEELLAVARERRLYPFKA
ncbi:MAG: PadR family transcriptional regulator [Longimicrobiales bacterium]